MNRHPYGGGGYDTSRRGGSPPSPGPDRSRFSRPSGRGGRGGGRGGGPSYYDNTDYEDGGYNHTPPGYSMNDPSHNDSYYYQGQTQHIGSGLASSFSNNPPYGSYEQGYGNTMYEDKSPPPGRGQYNSATRGKRGPPVRKERDDKIHDTLIEERIQRERPCRTLFIRNIKYETDSNEVRRRFEEHGEIKTFFDLISNRGMVFVTYYDLRAAERARERLQGSEISGRPIDVHYSLPRGDEQNQECDREKNQGTILVTLRNSVSGQPIDDTEVRRKFQQFGDVKTIKHGDRPDQRYVEMYDIRACQEAHDRLRHQGLQDGVMDIIFAWDVPEMPLPAGPPPPTNKRDGPRERYIIDDERPSTRGRGGGRGGRGGSRGGNRDNFRDRDPRDREMDDWERDRRDDWSRDRGRRYDEGPGYKGGHGRNAHVPDESRLEKAKKVQELLAALKQPQATSTQPPPSVPPSAPPSRMPPMPPSMPPMVTPNNQHYYPPPPPPAGSMQQPPPFIPPPNPYAYSPPPPPSIPSASQTQHITSAAQHTPAAGALPSSLPSNLLALLQQAQAQQVTTQASHQHSQQQPAAVSQLPYNLPPPHVPATPPVNQSTPASGLPPAQYQQLLAYIQSQQREYKGYDPKKVSTVY